MQCSLCTNNNEAVNEVVDFLYSFLLSHIDKNVMSTNIQRRTRLRDGEATGIDEVNRNLSLGLESPVLLESLSHCRLLPDTIFVLRSSSLNMRNHRDATQFFLPGKKASLSLGPGTSLELSISFAGTLLAVSESMT